MLDIDPQRHAASRHRDKQVFDNGKVAANKSKQIRRFGMRIVPDRKMPSAGRVAGLDQVAICEQGGCLRFVGLDARRVDGHDVGPVGEIGDPPEAFGFALRAIGTARTIKPGELRVRGWIDGRLNFKRKRPVWRLRDREAVRRCDEIAVRHRSSVEFERNQAQAVAVEHQWRCCAGRVRS